MTTTVLLVEGAVTLVIGGVTGYVVRHYVAVARRGSIDEAIEEKLLHAKREARAIEDEALTRASELREELKRNEERVKKQEERLDNREEEIATKDILLVKESSTLKQKTKELEEITNLESLMIPSIEEQIEIYISKYSFSQN